MKSPKARNYTACLNPERDRVAGHGSIVTHRSRQYHHPFLVSRAAQDYDLSTSNLDVLDPTQARVSEAAALLEVSTANLIEFLAISPKIWEEVQHLRGRFGQKPLRNT